MKVLVVGGGGREHAICWKISKSSKVEKVYCAPGNPGIKSVAECIDISPTDLISLKDFALNNATAHKYTFYTGNRPVAPFTG